MGLNLKGLPGGGGGWADLGGGLSGRKSARESRKVCSQHAEQLVDQKAFPRDQWERQAAGSFKQGSEQTTSYCQ